MSPSSIRSISRRPRPSTRRSWLPEAPATSISSVAIARRSSSRCGSQTAKWRAIRALASARVVLAARHLERSAAQLVGARARHEVDGHRQAGHQLGPDRARLVAGGERFLDQLHDVVLDAADLEPVAAPSAARASSPSAPPRARRRGAEEGVLRAPGRRPRAPGRPRARPALRAVAAGHAAARSSAVARGRTAPRPPRRPSATSRASPRG